MKRAIIILALLCLAAGEERDQKVVVPLTKAELTALEEAAKKAHLDVPHFVRSKVLEGIELEDAGEAKKAEETAGKEKATDEESPLKGWKVVSGEWRKEKNGVSCSSQGASLEYEGEIGESVEVQLTVTIRKWLSENPPRSVELVWSSGQAAEPVNHIVISSGFVIVCARPQRPGISDTTVKCDTPLNSPIPVRAIISRKGVQATIRGEKITVALPCEEIGKLRLAVGRADAVFSKVKVTSK